MRESLADRGCVRVRAAPRKNSIGNFAANDEARAPVSKLEPSDVAVVHVCPFVRSRCIRVKPRERSSRKWVEVGASSVEIRF